MEKFANYVLREKIQETRNSIIYRGHIEKEAQQFIIKLLKSRYPKENRFEVQNEKCAYFDIRILYSFG